MSAEATLKLVEGTPDSVYLGMAREMLLRWTSCEFSTGKQFVDAVEVACPLVDTAAAALAQREHRVAKEVLGLRTWVVSLMCELRTPRNESSWTRKCRMRES